mgnify:CR=1 FL=1
MIIVILFNNVSNHNGSNDSNSNNNNDNNINNNNDNNINNNYNNNNCSNSSNAIIIMILLVHFVNKGGGVEPESNYPRWKRFHQNIERYPALNDSIAKLTEGRLPHISFHFIPSIFMMINFLNAQSLYFSFLLFFVFLFC